MTHYVFNWGSVKGYIKILPRKKFKIIDEIPYSKELEKELKKRKKEIAHSEIWIDSEI